jgi:hypothetical protein
MPTIGAWPLGRTGNMLLSSELSVDRVLAVCGWCICAMSRLHLWATNHGRARPKTHNLQIAWVRPWAMLPKVRHTNYQTGDGTECGWERCCYLQCMKVLIFMCQSLQTWDDICLTFKARKPIFDLRNKRSKILSISPKNSFLTRGIRLPGREAVSPLHLFNNIFATQDLPVNLSFPTP